MPHFGLMDANNMRYDAALLLRAKLHVRCGKRRVREGKIAEGICTLYDAALSSMRWYAVSNEAIHAVLHQHDITRLENDIWLQQLINAHGAWPPDLNFQEFLTQFDTALTGNIKGLDPELFIKQIDSLLTHLGVLPFNEDELPPEDPDTF